MKKNNESFAAEKYDTSEVSRRLYRGALDAARRLEEFLRGNPHPDVLGADVTALRMRLKDYCERLLFSGSPDFSRKAEELLWRKVYYEPLQMYKQKRKKAASGGALESSDLLCGWLRSGVGHYHHLLLRLQAEYQLPEDSILEPQCTWRHRGLRKERWSRHQRSVCVRGQEDWATQTAHRCLMCLGDLSRYLSECGDPGSDHLSERYYRQAFLLLPALGMPFNQMGTLAALEQNKSCHALYFYLRCLLSPQSFEGADGNIQRVFEKNQPLYDEISGTTESKEKEVNISLVKRLCVRFIKLTELFYKQQENTTASLCQDVLQDLDAYLSIQDGTANQNSTNSNSNGSESEENQVEEEYPGLLIFRLGVVALMSFSRLQSQGSPLVSAAAAFVLSFLSQVVRHCSNHLQTCFFLEPNLSCNKKTFSSQSASSVNVNGAILSDAEKDCSWSPGAEEDGTRTRSTSGTLTPIAVANGALTDESLSSQSKNKPDPVDAKHSNSSVSNHKKHSLLLGHLRRRRRRKTSSTSQDDSEVSNEEGDFGESDVENGITSDISETGSAHGSDGSLTEQEEEEEPADKENTNHLAVSHSNNLLLVDPDQENSHECGSSSPGLDVIITDSPPCQMKWWETLEMFYQERFLLALIRVLSHWLTCQSDILSACAQSTHSLWKHYSDLLNVLINAESSLLTAEDTSLSCLSSSKCPRPGSSSTSNKTNGEDGTDNINNNNSSSANDSSVTEFSSAIEQWSWPGPLPEDVELQLMPFLVPPQKSTTNKNNPATKLKSFQSFSQVGSNRKLSTTAGGEVATKYFQVFGRIQCLLHFGLVHSLTSRQQKIPARLSYLGKNGYAKMAKTETQEQLFSFDPAHKLFSIFEGTQGELQNQDISTQSKCIKKSNQEVASTNGQDSSSDLEGQRKQLMRNMAHLWLKAEVQDLEGRTGSARGSKGHHFGAGGRHNYHPPGGRQGGLQGGCLPPYLVPDTSALCQQLPALKQLQAARRFIIILPSSVISSLDELKRQSAYAREAIRWIEAELRGGSRFLRPQKSQERMTLMPMKYPKRKEKEAWEFFQVLECCNYLNKNHSQGYASSAPLVTLVTGGSQFLPTNAVAVASSAGVSMESAEDFLNKWRNSLKS